jgi:hypothetical protein
MNDDRSALEREAPYFRALFFRKPIPDVVMRQYVDANILGFPAPDRRDSKMVEMILARRIDADGTTLGTVHDLSASNADSTRARVAIDSQDRATVVWENDSDGVIQSARIGADGTPESPQTLSGLASAEAPQVAIDSQDRATVVWDGFDGSGNLIQARRIGAGGTAEDVKTLSAAGGLAFDAAVAIDSQDRPRVAWASFDGSYLRVQSVRGVDLDLTTAASPDTTIGNSVHDSATLAGGASPTGKIVFRLYGPNNPACAGGAASRTRSRSPATASTRPETPLRRGSAPIAGPRRTPATRTIPMHRRPATTPASR